MAARGSKDYCRKLKVILWHENTVMLRYKLALMFMKMLGRCDFKLFFLLDIKYNKAVTLCHEKMSIERAQ